MDYNNVFIGRLRGILAGHGDNPRQHVADSRGRNHYVLPKQRHPREPKRWIYIKLELDDGAETTLRVRDDNVYLIGFENKRGELFEFGFSGTMMIDGSNKQRSMPMLRDRQSRFLECDVNYGSLASIRRGGEACEENASRPRPRAGRALSRAPAIQGAAAVSPPPPPPPPPPPNKRRRTEQQHDQDQPPPPPSDKGSGDSQSHQQETPPESPADDYVARGRPLVEVFAVRAGFHFVGTISVFDGMRGQVIYENDNNGSSSSSGGDDQPRPLLLTGPYRAISAYGSFAIQVDISGAGSGDVGELDWDCYDQEKVYDTQVTETITTSSSGRKVHVTYAVLSDAVDAELEVHLRLPGATAAAAAVYGRIATRSKAFLDEDTAWSVLFDSEVEGVPLVADSEGVITRLPLARSVVAMPLGSPLLITATLYDAPPSQHGVSPVFQFQEMELTLAMGRRSADSGGGEFQVSITSPDHYPRPRRNDTATPQQWPTNHYGCS